MLYSNHMMTPMTHRELKRELLKNPEFKKAYDELEPEFQLWRKLIEKRNKGGLTQKELAKRMGTKQSVISRFESGRTNPTLDFLYRLAEALGAELKITVR